LSSDDLKKGGQIAQKGFVIITAVAIAELIMGSLSGSVALLADGIHSFATAAILLIIWIGLRLSGRSPNGTFHFGYYRVESLGSLFAAFVLVTFGGFIIFEAYRAWQEQRIIFHPEISIIVASVSALVALLVTIWIERASETYRSTALEAGGLTGVIDVLSSVAVAVGIALSSFFSILHADSIAGILIAVAIFVAAYSIFKESSLVLVDACRCGDVVNAIAEVARDVRGIKEVHSVRMRKLGSYMSGDMHIVVSSEMLVREADEIATEVEEKIKKEFGRVIDIKVRIESDEAHDRHSKEFEVKDNK
jgi:cation diffusion facilitator family transporter